MKHRQGPFSYFKFCIILIILLIILFFKTHFYLSSLSFTFICCGVFSQCGIGTFTFHQRVSANIKNKNDEVPCLLHYLPFSKSCLFNHMSLPKAQ